MNIIYNDVDIKSSVQPLKLQISDNAGGKPDSITAIFSDTEGLWSKWKPSKNDTFLIRKDGFDTGRMYIDELAQGAGVFEIKALSIPQTAKTARSQGWENVRYLEIATQIAARYGFSIQTYNVINHLYERVDQHEEPDLAFLAYRSMLEGYTLKINDNSLVIYDEESEEKKTANETAIIRKNDIHGSFEFRSKSTDIYAKCIVRNQSINGLLQGEFSDQKINGSTLKKNIYVSNQAEANRWAKGLLRAFNKFETYGSFIIDLNTKIAAGIPAKIQEIGLFDGTYFIDQLTHDLINSRTRLLVRKPLEGY